MANEEHIAVLQQGVKVWNQWREANPAVRPDLMDASLNKLNLSEINFRDTDLRGAYLSETTLNLADLSHADLRVASLHGTHLYRTRLANANLLGANLNRTDFNSTELAKANFTIAKTRYTVFSDVDLSKVIGLDTVRHQTGSSVDVQTIYRSGGNIPEVFLRGAGVPETFITFMKSLTNQAIDFYSCFISHSSKDQEFAERLFADLQNNSVRCWYAPHHMEIGAPILNEIDSAIRVHDKLLLILSENSVGSRWVEHEVLSATTKEFQQERDIRTLFPIRLDDAVMDTNVQWARNLKETRHIADFTGWKDHDRYKVAFDRLLRDLKGKS